jgi:hypothetical protein
MQASLTINMHAHISLGKWEVNPDDPGALDPREFCEELAV